jgi:hypothetical protein
VLQLIIQIGRAAQPGLPSLLFRFYSALLLLQLDGVTLHPNCMGTPPFQQDIAEMAMGVALMAILCLLFLNCLHVCRCTCCGVGERTGQRLLSDGAFTHRLSADTLAAGSMAGADRQKRASANGSVSGPLNAWCERWGRNVDRAKPFLRRIVFTLLTLLYATVSNAALRMLPCETHSLRAADYLQLWMDGSTLKAQLGIGLSEVASACVDANCERRNPWYDRTVSVSVLTSNPAFVCYESAHFAVVLLAWTCLAVNTLGYPIFVFLLLRRRISQIMERGPLRQQYELALTKDHLRRQAWTKAGGDARCRCWRRLCVKLGCLGSHFSRTEAAAAPLGVLAWCAYFCSAVTPVDSEEAMALSNTAAATEAFARTVARLQAESGQAPKGATALDGRHRLPQMGSPLATSELSSGTGVVELATVSQLPIPNPLDVGASVAKSRSPVVVRGCDTSGSRSRCQASSRAPRSSCSGAVAVSTGVRGAGDFHARSVPRLSSAGLGSSSAATAHLAKATRVAVTANALIDGNPSIIRDVSLAHFTASDYRASRYWMRAADMAVLFALGLLAAFWPRTTDPPWCAGLLALTAAIVFVQATVIVAQKPFKQESHWMLFVRLATLLLALSSALLNLANAINPLPAAIGNNSSLDGLQRPPIVTAFSNLAFACSMLLGVVLVASFLLSLWQGARKEEADTQLVAVAERAAAEQPRTIHNAILIVSSPVQPAAMRAEELVLQRQRRYSPGALKFGLVSVRSGRQEGVTTRRPQAFAPRLWQPQQRHRRSLAHAAEPCAKEGPASAITSALPAL